MLLSIILYYFSISNTTKFITAYSIGYTLISVIVQYYSLREEKIRKEIEKLKQEEVKEIKEKEEKEEIKEIKVKEEIKEIEEVEKK
jgi:uncharacterized membrane protein (DUF106 family)